MCEKTFTVVISLQSRYSYLSQMQVGGEGSTKKEVNTCADNVCIYNDHLKIKWFSRSLVAGARSGSI